MRVSDLGHIGVRVPAVLSFHVNEMKLGGKSMKDFFKKTWVKIVASILVAIGTLVLLLGGSTVEEIVKIPSAVFGIFTAIGGLILLISGLINSKKE